MFQVGDINQPQNFAPGGHGLQRQRGQSQQRQRLQNRQPGDLHGLRVAMLAAFERDAVAAA